MRLNILLGVGIVLALIGASLLVSFGLLYLRPHLDVRHLVEGQCFITTMGYTSDLVQCTCASDGGGSNCLSQYPCLRLSVNISRRGEVVAENATLYDSYETYVLQSSTLQCSYHKCSRSLSDNVDAVQSFAGRFKSEDGTTLNKLYRCYYDPDDAGYALMEIVGLATAVNSIVWPVLATVVGLAIVFFQIFHADTEHWHQKTTRQFGSLERQWARIRERHYGRMTSVTGGCSERLVSADVAPVDAKTNCSASQDIH